MSSWSYAQPRKPWQGGIGAALTIGIHAGVIALVLADRGPTIAAQPAPINVSIISDMPQPQTQPLETPTKPRLDQPKLHIPQPDIVLAESMEPSTAPVAVSSAASAANSAPATPAVVMPVFDADYLNNPSPSYPPLSRRMREQGVVYLRVLVSADGTPDQVELKHSSGSVRLDESALCTVKKWRFVPARRGNQTVAAWVVVPIAFSLTA
ncbi:MAG: energy transducer TonB [Spongiibacteraceae bacterium]